MSRQPAPNSSGWWIRYDVLYTSIAPIKPDPKDQGARCNSALQKFRLCDLKLT